MDLERLFCDEEPFMIELRTYNRAETNYLTAKSLFLSWNESPLRLL